MILRSQVFPNLTSPIFFYDYAQSSGENIFYVSGYPDQQFTLDSSTNLANLTTGPLLDFIYPSGTLTFITSLPSSPPARQFYRATRSPDQPGAAEEMIEPEKPLFSAIFSISGKENAPKSTRSGFVKTTMKNRWQIPAVRVALLYAATATLRIPRADNLPVFSFPPSPPSRRSVWQRGLSSCWSPAWGSMLWCGVFCGPNARPATAPNKPRVSGGTSDHRRTRWRIALQA